MRCYIIAYLKILWRSECNFSRTNSASEPKSGIEIQKKVLIEAPFTKAKTMCPVSPRATFPNPEIYTSDLKYSKRFELSKKFPVRQGVTQ